MNSNIITRIKKNFILKKFKHRVPAFVERRFLCLNTDGARFPSHFCRVNYSFLARAQRRLHRYATCTLVHSDCDSFVAVAGFPSLCTVCAARDGETLDEGRDFRMKLPPLLSPADAITTLISLCPKLFLPTKRKCLRR